MASLSSNGTRATPIYKNHSVDYRPILNSCAELYQHQFYDINNDK